MLSERFRTESLVIYLYVPSFEKKGFTGFAKIFDPGQPAQSAQADLSRNVLLIISPISACQSRERVFLIMWSVFKENGLRLR